MLEGRGERAVVLSGSLGSTLEMWEPQLPALTERFRVLRYDHPGHGGSPLQDVRTVEGLAEGVVALLDELGLERVSFCGLSLGGAVGMRLALDVPGRIDRLGLCCTSPRFGSPEAWDERARLVRSRGAEAVADVVLARWFTPDFADVRRYRAMLVSTPAEGYARCCEAVATGMRGARSAGSARPTLAIAGGEDPAAPPEDLEAIAAEIAGARVIVLERARHLANVERAEAFNPVLLAHRAG